MKVSRGTRLSLRVVALGYLFALVGVPIAVILWRTFSPGLSEFLASISTPAAQSALNLSLLIVAITVPVNVVFGVATALALRPRPRRLQGDLRPARHDPRDDLRDAALRGA